MTSPAFHYHVAMPDPQRHYFHVTLTVQGWEENTLNLKFPVWTPGSYLVREYERHVQELEIWDADRQTALTSEKRAKNHWHCETPDITTLRITYRVYAYELTVRTNHLDPSHGFFTGAALFFYIPGYETRPLTLTVIPPDATWRIAAPLPLKETDGMTGAQTFAVQDFDTLVDSPVEVGIHQAYDFDVLGKPHRWVIWGEGNFNADQIIADTQKIITTEAELWGGLPYEDYLFILHLTAQGYGGLEHNNSCVLLFNRFDFRDLDKYHRFLQLVAHEFFHLWNVKRLRPRALVQFDYDQENYTPSLWFAEGATSYYDLLIPLRAGLYDQPTFLKQLGKEITRYLTTPGRRVQPLAESSFDAWIKLYRRDANSDNSQISYYLKGELVVLILDLLIRDRQDNQRSFDDVLRNLWVKYGETGQGYTPQELEAEIMAVADEDLTDFFALALHSTDPLPLQTALEPFGLRIKECLEDWPFLGLKVQSQGGKDVITFVAAQSPAEQAGISPQDELLALDGLRVSAEQLPQRLKDYQANDMIQVTVFHQDRLRTVEVALAPPQASRYEVVPIANPSAAQRHKLAGWLGTA